MSEVKILVPLDGSALAEKAVRYAEALKPLGELRVRLISALDTYEGMDIGRTYDQWQETQANDAAVLLAYLESQAERLRSAGACVEAAVLHGAAAAAIITDAEEFGADLVIISTHGRSGLQRWRLGSVADKVVRGSGRSTLVVGPQLGAAEGGRAIRSLLVPLDGSELAAQALPVAERYAQALGARLHLVRAVVYPVVADDAAGYAYTPQLFESMISGAQSYIEDIAGRCTTKDCAASVLVGPPVEQLEQYIKAKAIDLVVMTSHGRGGFVRTALGSVTDRLISGAAPVLVVRPTVA